MFATGEVVELKGLVAALHHQGAARVPYDPAAATAAHASARKRPPRPKPPGGSSSRKAPPAPISTSLAGALADDQLAHQQVAPGVVQVQVGGDRPAGQQVERVVGEPGEQEQKR